jgi:hypothetical protein
MGDRIILGVLHMVHFLPNVKATHPLPGANFDEGVMG